jgi:hypothetical protein
MFLFSPFRALRLLTLGPRILGRTLFFPRFHLVRTAIVVLGIVALVSYFTRRKGSPPLS